MMSPANFSSNKLIYCLPYILNGVIASVYRLSYEPFVH